MNILIIPTSDWIRAPGRGHIDLIAEKLLERGHNIYVWHFDLFRYSPIKRKAKGIKLIEPKTLWTKDLAAFYTVNALLQMPILSEAMRDFSIDCVISENLLHGVLAFIISSSSVLKIFNYSDYFPESASIHYLESMPVIRGLVKAIVLSITKLNIKLSDVCIAPCRSLLQMINKIDDKKNRYLLTNGVDTTLFTPSKVGNINHQRLGLSKNVITLVGLIEPWLDLITVVEGLRILREKIDDIKLLLLGPRNGKYQQVVQNFVAKNGLNEQVVWTDYVPHEFVPRYINLAKCCLMPFRTDLFLSSIVLPVKFFEYSACGKPILSTPLPEIVALDADHVLFYNDPMEFARCAELLLCDEKFHNKLSAKARDFAKEHDYAVLAKQLENIIAEEIRKKRKRCG
jgi:glycosyltransferase involved in cell wall biosynthesis